MTDRRKAFIKIQKIADEYFSAAISSEDVLVSFVCDYDYEMVEFEIQLENEFGLTFDFSTVGHQNQLSIKDLLDFILEN